MMRHEGRARVPSTFSIVEIALFICLQTHREFVEVFRDLVIAVEVLVEIRFSVSVEIVQANDLIPTAHKYVVADQLHPERLKQS